MAGRVVGSVAFCESSNGAPGTNSAGRLTTFAGNAGCAIHLYAANRSMEGRFFYDADGELLIVPQEGALRFATDALRDSDNAEIVVISDGRDNGSSSDLEKVVADANRRRIPIHTIGHSELDQDSLANLEQLSRRTNGTYKASPAVDDVTKNLSVIRDFINKMYVVQYKTKLAHDGKDHKIEIAMESEASTPLKASIMVRTPAFTDWIKIGIIAGLILLVIIAAIAIYVLTRPKPPPERYCAVCKRAQLPEWETCLFCLKSAKARITS